VLTTRNYIKTRTLIIEKKPLILKFRMSSEEFINTSEIDGLLKYIKSVKYLYRVKFLIFFIQNR
jgi:hypothetical protein